MEQTFMHLAIMNKEIKNLQASRRYWICLLKVHERVYGHEHPILAADYKNIGICELGLGTPASAQASYQKAIPLSKAAVENAKNDEEKKEEKEQLAQLYFSLYLAFLAQEKWNDATQANEDNRVLNEELFDKNNLNISNNYYLGAQLFMKDGKVNKAHEYINKANEILDNREGEIQPLLLGRYQFLKAKIESLMGNRELAYKCIVKAIETTQSIQELKKDYNDMVKFKNDLLQVMDDSLKSSLGITDEDITNS